MDGWNFNPSCSVLQPLIRREVWDQLTQLVRCKCSEWVLQTKDGDWRKALAVGKTAQAAEWNSTRRWTGYCGSKRKKKTRQKAKNLQGSELDFFFREAMFGSKTLHRTPREYLERNWLTKENGRRKIHWKETNVDKRKAEQRDAGSEGAWEEAKSAAAHIANREVDTKKKIGQKKEWRRRTEAGSGQRSKRRENLITEVKSSSTAERGEWEKITSVLPASSDESDEDEDNNRSGNIWLFLYVLFITAALKSSLEVQPLPSSEIKGPQLEASTH